MSFLFLTCWVAELKEYILKTAEEKGYYSIGWENNAELKELTEKAGIGSPFDEKAVIELADTLKTKLN